MLASMGKGMKVSVHERRQKLNDALGTVESNPLITFAREFPFGRKLLQQAIGSKRKLGEEAGKYDDIRTKMNNAVEPEHFVALQAQVNLLHTSHRAHVTSEKLSALLARMVILFCECYKNKSLIPDAVSKFTQCEGLSDLHILHEASQHYSEVYTELIVMVGFLTDFQNMPSKVGG